ncbi:hypothetical protein ACFL42_04630 [Candidatus Omnitrophota bacterium]
MKNHSALTICSVDYDSKKFLDLNWRLTRRLNETGEFKWLVVDNNPADSDKRLDRNDKRFHVINGVPHSSIIHCFACSAHHAAGLKKALPHINTRFVLFLDPDYYIVRDRWIDEIMAHMRCKGLSFFGAPWHPAWFVKYRYFPSAHCLFVDLDKVNIETLDFRPDHFNVLGCVDKAVREGKASCSAAINNRGCWKRRKLSTLLLKVPLANRLINIGKEKDTGYFIFRKYGRNPLFRRGCLVPAFNPKEALGKRKEREFIVSWRNRLVERFLPDRLCYAPKRKGYYSKSGFHDLGYFDANALGWEEFLYRGRPFGFHLRSMPKVMRDVDRYDQLSDLERAVEFFMKKINYKEGVSLR